MPEPGTNQGGILPAESRSSEPQPLPLSAGQSVETGSANALAAATIAAVQSVSTKPATVEGIQGSSDKTKAALMRRQIVSRSDKRFLFGVLSAVLLAITAYILAVSIQQFGRYNAEAEMARSLLTKDTPVEEKRLLLSFIVVTTGPQEVLVMRHITVFLGFVVVFIGAMFVLTGIETSYQLGLKGVQTATTLKTSSPGLVLITLGALLVFSALYRDVGVSFNVEKAQAPDAQKEKPHGQPYDGPVVE